MTYILFKSINVHTFYTGESGLVYKAYVKKGGQTDIFAIKTGKGENIVGVYQ